MDDYRLPREVAIEIDQVAHFGKAKTVKDLMTAAAEAFDAGHYADVVGPLLQAKRAAPRSASVRELLGLALYRLGRWREAARELGAYRRLSGERDQDPVFADAERALGRPDKALDILHGLAPAEVGEELWVEGLIVAAGALGDLDRHEEAVIILQRGPLQPPHVEPHHLRLYYALADALERAGRRADARDWWDLVYAEDPEFFDVAERRLGIKPR